MILWSTCRASIDHGDIREIPSVRPEREGVLGDQDGMVDGQENETDRASDLKGTTHWEAAF